MSLSFDKLFYASHICHSTHPYLLRFDDWATKREHVALYLFDIPNLLRDYAQRRTTPHPHNPRGKLIDALPGLRLSTACEALAHCVYAMAEIAATVANRASKGKVPSSFNAICKKVHRGDLDAALMRQLPDLDWYARVRELRTEWSHHSSIFVGGDDADPLICVRAFRRQHDQVIIQGKLQMRPRDLMEWSERATAAIDGFGAAVFTHCIAPSLPLDNVVYTPERDEYGFPRMTDDGRLVGRNVTVRDYLAAGGIDLNELLFAK